LNGVVYMLFSYVQPISIVMRLERMNFDIGSNYGATGGPELMHCDIAPNERESERQQSGRRDHYLYREQPTGGAAVGANGEMVTM
jgi:hypothetical protein